MLLEQLPAESRLVTALRGGIEYIGWDKHTQLLADVFDAVQFLAFLYASANSKKKPKVPDPYPRPGADDAEEEKRKMPNPLTAALKGEEIVSEVGPGSVIPLPPKR